MPKRAFNQSVKRRRSNNRLRQKKTLVLIILGLLLVSYLGAVVGPWRNSLGARKLRGLISSYPPPPATPDPTKPSKEYIYAGGKLVATEEPSSGSSLTAPTSLVATGTSKAQINVTWNGISSAHHYEVESSPVLDGTWTVLSSNVLTTSFPDNTVTEFKAYLYRVRAVDVGGNVSPYSNLDVATAITFTDNPLEPNSTPIRAQHIWELRKAVDAIRAAAKLPAVNWTNNVSTAAGLVGVNVRAVHVEELRSNLDEALGRLGVSVSGYADPAPPGLSGLPIRKIHIDQLRERVK